MENQPGNGIITAYVKMKWRMNIYQLQIQNMATSTPMQDSTNSPTGAFEQKLGPTALPNRRSPRAATITLAFVFSLCLANLYGSIIPSQAKFNGLLLSSADSFRGEADTNLTRAGETSGNNNTRHILFALSGNEKGFMNEFEVALKSVLLNLPHEHPAAIHILADGPAHSAVCDVLRDRSLYNWTTAAPLQIIVYNVQNRIDTWTAVIEKRMTVARNMTSYSLFRHTVGAYFRLLSGEILPSEVESVLYLDTDVVVLANLEHLWSHHVFVHSNNNLTNNRREMQYFQWGASKCSAFMVLRPQLMSAVWDLFARVPNETLELLLRRRPVADDQFVLQAVHHTFPEVVGPDLPVAYDVSAQDGPWKYGKAHMLLPHRPDGAGMLHFNGGGESKEAYFRQHPYVEKPIWNLVQFFVHLPWTWAKFMVESHVAKGGGYRVAIVFR